MNNIDDSFVKIKRKKSKKDFVEVQKKKSRKKR